MAKSEKIIKGKKIEEKYNPKKEIEKISKKHKIFLTDPSEAEALKIAGFLPLVHKELLSFLERKEKNGYYILYVTDPNHKEHSYPCKIKYIGVEEPKEKSETVFTGDFLIYNEDGKPKGVSIDNVVNHLLEKYNFKTIYYTKSEIIYFYENGIWNKSGREKIKTETERLLKSWSKNNIVLEIVEKIKRKTAISEEKFNKIPEELICIENGVLNLKNKEFIPFNPNYYFQKQIPLQYNGKANCKKIIKFIEETFYPEDIETIQEWLGFCLYKKYFIKKAIILFGEKNTGKTLFLNILSKFIGEKNCAGISLQRIASKDKFSIAFLKNKFVNVYDDLSANDLSDSGGFKIATGGGYATGEHKFGDSFQFFTFAKNIFATNKIPNIKDINDDAYYERWIPIALDNQIEQKKQDNFLFEKITTKEEMSGLLNWALKGLDRLFKNGKFSYPKTSEQIKTLMQRQNNPLVAFVDEVLEQEDENKISKEIMYKIYSKWSQDKKVPRLSKEQLGRNLAKYTNYIIAKGGKERVWENVKIKKSYREIL